MTHKKLLFMWKEFFKCRIISQHITSDPCCPECLRVLMYSVIWFIVSSQKRMINRVLKRLICFHYLFCILSQFQTVRFAFVEMEFWDESFDRKGKYMPLIFGMNVRLDMEHIIRQITFMILTHGDVFIDVNVLAISSCWLLTVQRFNKILVLAK